MEVTKDMLIGEILKKDQTIAAILMASGMHCVGCPASQGESRVFDTCFLSTFSLSPLL